MTLGSVCICTLDRVVRGCPRHAPSDWATLESIHRMLIKSLENQEKIMADTTNLLAADTALQAEVATVISDWQTTLASANGDQTVVDQVTADMQATVTKLQAADPVAAAGTGTATPPAGTTAPAAPAS